MKKLILVLVLIVFFVSNVFSQKKIISQDEFFSAQIRASELSDNSIRRIRTEETTYENGETIKTVTKINEIVDKNNQRFILSEKAGKKLKKTEWIKCQSKVYKRKNDGKWIKTKEWQDGSVDRVVMGNPEYTLEKVKIDDKEITLLESFTKYYFENVQRFILEKFYINEKGYVLKIEMSFGVYEPQEVESREIAIYKYNPKDLKIEAPIK